METDERGRYTGRVEFVRMRILVVESNGKRSKRLKLETRRGYDGNGGEGGGPG